MVPTTEPMLTMRPLRRRIMPRTAARDRRNAAVRLTAMTWSHSSSFIRTKMLSRVMPALLTRMSRPPSAASAAGTSASTAAVSDRLVGSTWARSPSSVASAASASARVPDRATAAPCACSARAMAPPSPPVAPVTRAFLPVRSNMRVTY